MKKTVKEIKEMKEKVSVITCYDYSFAKAIDGQVDMILVGDSIGNVVLGYERTSKVEMEDMIRHLRAVRKGAPDTFIVCDLPHGSYEDENEAISNAKKLIQEGADAVKPEGKPNIVKALVDNNIEVMAHLGLLPQTAEKFSLVGKEEKEAEELFKEVRLVEEAGAFSVVLESVPGDLAEKITDEISIPTIGIGAGNKCSGQVLVLYDLLGLFPDFTPKFVRQYANLKEVVKKAVQNYSKDVKSGDFHSENETIR